MVDHLVNVQMWLQWDHEDRCYSRISRTLKMFNDLIENAYRNELFMQKGKYHGGKEISDDEFSLVSGGAFGYFEATDDLSDVCKAKVFKKGTKTRVLIRFSTVGMYSID